MVALPVTRALVWEVVALPPGAVPEAASPLARRVVVLEAASPLARQVVVLEAVLPLGVVRVVVVLQVEVAATLV